MPLRRVDPDLPEESAKVSEKKEKEQVKKAAAENEDEK